MIELSNLDKIYTMGDNEVRALQGVSLTIEQGEYVAIMGPSGSGKSTLMHIIGFLDAPSSGSYKIDGAELSHMEPDELAVLRREAVGFIFQQFNLLPRMNLFDNVSLPLLYSRLNFGDSWIESLIERVGLKERIMHRPNELSGGQQQRVAIARALVNRPRIILADEPTGNLDSASEAEILAMLDELNGQGITIVVVTHEEEIAAHAKRVIRMRDGKVISDVKNQGEAKPFAKAQPAPIPAKKRFRGFEFTDYFKQGIISLASNKVRTLLSILGIMIGVTAVVTMVAVGSGAKESIESQLKTLGSNLLILRQGAVVREGVAQQAGATTRLTMADVDALKKEIPWVKESAATVTGAGQVSYLNENWNTQVIGADANYDEMRDYVPTIGRFFTDAENKKRSRVAVIGATVVKSLFGDKDPIGEMIKINRVSFQVIGILPPKGASTFGDRDDVIVIPVLTGMYRLFGKDYVESINLEIADNNKIEESKQMAIDLMTARHRVPKSQKEDAFQVFNLSDIQDTLTKSSQTLSLLLSFVAMISLLVGGIGIMNIMLVSVTERTKEIGLRKAIGAKSKDILSQFLAEAVAVSLVGGAFGILFAWGITTVIAKAAHWRAPISPYAVLLAVIFSGAIGIIFGLYPARKAARLHPIEALRFE